MLLDYFTALLHALEAAYSVYMGQQAGRIRLIEVARSLILHFNDCGGAFWVCHHFSEASS